MESNPEIADSSVSSLGYVAKEEIPAALKRIESMRKQDMHVVFLNCCYSPNVGIEVWNYFKEALPFYNNLFKTTSFILPAMCEGVISLAHNESELEDMKRYFRENPVEIAEQSIKSQIALVEKRLENQKKYAEEIKNAFNVQ